MPVLRKEIDRYLDDWIKNSLSVLFFRNLRKLSIGDQIVGWTRDGTGPMKGSEWMKSTSTLQGRYLIIRSEPINFPSEALEEIRTERMLTEEELTTFPPCQIDLVLGAEGRLFVVLPTGVKTNLPFALNAPFLQDPARIKIKDPELSETNRWLLGQIGTLSCKGVC